MLLNCLAYQVMLSHAFEQKHEEYYAKGVKSFREDISDPRNPPKDATLVAGLLLCRASVGLCSRIEVAAADAFDIS